MLNSTQLCDACQKDYEMLKEQGKEGEGVLHMHGYLDGFGHGFREAEAYTKMYCLEQFCQWLTDSANNIYWEVESPSSKKPMGEIFREQIKIRLGE